MPWLRRRGRRWLLLHSRRSADRVVQERLGAFASPCDLLPEVRASIERENPDIRFPWTEVLADAIARERSGGYRVVRGGMVQLGGAPSPVATGRTIAPTVHPRTLAEVILAGVVLEPLPA